MADRYENERERNRWEEGRRDQDREREGWRDNPYDRGEWGRNEPRYYGEGRYERGGDWNREGRFDRGDWNRENRFDRGDWNRGERGDWNRGDWNRGERENRFSGRDWNRERENEGRFGEYGRPSWARERDDYGRFSGRDLYGTGQSGFGTTWGGYSGGNFTSATYGGGIGSHGERGRHTGRGPKGYQRSDERIREDINERLTQHPEIDASDIEVQVKNGEVTLTGTVERRDVKRMAEDVAENVSGVKEVHNQLRTGQHPETPTTTTTGSTTRSK